MPTKHPPFKLTPAALTDLKQIARYTQSTWGKQKRTIYLTAMNNRFEWLSEYPNAGMRRDELGDGFLSYPEGKHVIFYRKKAQWIEILAILHQSMDFRKHL